MYLRISHLRILQALAQTGSLTKAAGYLHLTQSALSHQISALEKHFGLRLFYRKSQPLRLTVAGQKLLDLAERVLPWVQATEDELRRMQAGETGRLHIALECHSCFQWLMPALDAYRQQWPDVELDLTQSYSFEPLPALRAHRVDLVIASEAVEDTELTAQPLFGYESVLVVSPEHPLATKAIIDARDLQEEILITYPVSLERLDVFSGFLQPAGIRPRNIRHAELTPMILQLVASRRGVAALPRWAVEEYPSHRHLVLRRLGEQGLWVNLYAIIRKADEQQAYFKAWIEQARASSIAQLPGIRPATAVGKNDNAILHS